MSDFEVGVDFSTSEEAKINRLTIERDEARRTMRTAHEEGTRLLAEKDAEIARLKEEIRVTKEEDFPRKIEVVSNNWRKQLADSEAKVAEACAKVCEAERSEDGDGQHPAWYAGFDACAEAIRNGEWREYM